MTLADLIRSCSLFTGYGSLRQQTLDFGEPA